MTSSEDHLLPQAIKTLEAGWIKVLENSFHGNSCHWMDWMAYKIVFCISNFEVFMIYSHSNLILASVTTVQNLFLLVSYLPSRFMKAICFNLVK